MRTHFPCTQCKCLTQFCCFRCIWMDTRVLKMLIVVYLWPFFPFHAAETNSHFQLVLTETFQRSSQPLPMLLFLTTTLPLLHVILTYCLRTKKQTTAFSCGCQLSQLKWLDQHVMKEHEPDGWMKGYELFLKVNLPKALLWQAD